MQEKCAICPRYLFLEDLLERSEEVIKRKNEIIKAQEKTLNKLLESQQTQLNFSPN